MTEPTFRTSIIIPSIRNNALLLKCVEACLAQGEDVEVLVMSGEDGPSQAGHPRLRFFNCGPANMSAKRNRGVEASRAPFVAFIDSDAYPAPGWIAHAIRELETDPDIAMVGGPELPPDDETLSERYVGLASRSVLVTGAHAFRKSISPRRFFSEVSSCNLIMRRAEYAGAGGMDESLYIGEDNDLCRRVARTGRKLLFSPDVVVHHKNRSFVPFLIQRYARGMATALVIRTFLRDSLRDGRLRPNFRYELVLAPGFIVFTLTAVLIPYLPAWALVYVLTWALFLAAIALETRKHAESARDVGGLFATLVCGTLASGIGAFFSMLGLEPDIKKYYRNRNDEA